MSSQKSIDVGCLTSDAPRVNFEVSLAVLDKAVDEGVAQAEVPESREERRSWAEKRRWVPKYPEIKYDKNGFD